MTTYNLTERVIIYIRYHALCTQLSQLNIVIIVSVLIQYVTHILPEGSRCSFLITKCTPFLRESDRSQFHDFLIHRMMPHVPFYALLFLSVQGMEELLQHDHDWNVVAEMSADAEPSEPIVTRNSLSLVSSARLSSRPGSQRKLSASPIQWPRTPGRRLARRERMKGFHGKKFYEDIAVFDPTVQQHAEHLGSLTNLIL